MKLSLWRKQESPRALAPGTRALAEGDVLWVNLPADSEATRASLEEALAHLGVPPPKDTLRLLFDETHYPGCKHEDDTGAIRSVVAFQAEAAADDSKTVLLRVVEFLQYESVLITRSQPSRTLSGPRDGDREGPRLDPDDWCGRVEQRWKDDDASTSGDLGTVALYALVKSYTDARRKLHDWLDDVELNSFTDETTTGALREDLLSVRHIVHQLTRRVRALKVPSALESESWFADLTDRARATKTDDCLSRALADFDRMAAQVREISDLTQFKLAQQSKETSESLQHRLELVTAVLLVPTLIAGVFGANTALPGGGRWEGFGVMVLLMALGAVATLVTLRSFGNDRDD